MRMQTYRSHIVLNTSTWLVGVLQELKEDHVFPPHFHTDMFHTFFQNIDQLIQRGHLRIMENRRELKENMLNLVVADLEGGYRNPNGLMLPMEFEPKEMEIIVKMICYLTDDILLSIDASCLEDTTTTIEFKRLVGHDVLISYTSNYHPFQAPGNSQLTMMRRLHAEDYDHDIEPLRYWI